MLQQPGLFFLDVRAGLLGPTLSPDEVAGCNAILDAMKGAPLSWTAYALATAYHETAHTMQPIKELGGTVYFTRMYDINGRRPDKARRLGNVHPGDGAKFCGRGYVQITGRDNYRKAGDCLEINLVDLPELALRPDFAAKIMRRGMQEGWFTGVAFDAYLPDKRAATKDEFKAARHIINGVDRDELIAGYALEFQRALQEGGWTV